MTPWLAATAESKRGRALDRKARRFGATGDSAALLSGRRTQPGDIPGLSGGYRRGARSPWRCSTSPGPPVARIDAVPAPRPGAGRSAATMILHARPQAGSDWTSNCRELCAASQGSFGRFWRAGAEPAANFPHDPHREASHPVGRVLDQAQRPMALRRGTRNRHPDPVRARSEERRDLLVWAPSSLAARHYADGSAEVPSSY